MGPTRSPTQYTLWSLALQRAVALKWSKKVSDILKLVMITKASFSHRIGFAFERRHGKGHGICIHGFIFSSCLWRGCLMGQRILLFPGTPPESSHDRTRKFKVFLNQNIIFRVSPETSVQAIKPIGSQVHLIDCWHRCVTHAHLMRMCHHRGIYTQCVHTSLSYPHTISSIQFLPTSAIKTHPGSTPGIFRNAKLQIRIVWQNDWTEAE
jgi:hypothetical protein